MSSARNRVIGSGGSFILALATACTAHSGETTSGTVELGLEMGSPVVELEVSGKNGKSREIRFLVDTGGGGLMLPEAIADDLGLAIQREEVHEEEGMRFAPLETPHIEIDGFALDLGGARCAAVLGETSVLPGSTPEGFLPGHVLAKHHVIFDYPARRFTLAKPGSRVPRGERVSSPVEAQSGFPRIELDVAGRKAGFLLDSGASFTMISITELEHWRVADARLASLSGAVGEANMVGGPMETNAMLLQLPALRWGPFALDGVLAVSRPPGTFEGWMSGMMTEPIIGAIGGNVLRNFRVEIDYAAGATYLESSAKDFSTHLDGVGFVLGETPAGEHRVDAVAREGEHVLCEGVEAGDLLREVDGKPLAGLRHRQVIELLRGKPGTARKLKLERAGQPVEVSVEVQRFLERNGSR